MVSKWSEQIVDTDVLILGAGLAGLTLARQLHLEHPELSVTLLDRLERPLPEAGFKVGESIVELASHYLRDVLQLADYFDKAHLRKLGIRMFFQSSGAEFADRPEFGLSTFATIPTHQIDRGRMENDLREIVQNDGARLLEGARIDRVDLGQNGEPHRVSYYHGGAPEPHTVSARWVVDASGRSRMLQRQLGLTHSREADHNAVWFRVKGRLDVDQLVPAENKEWHDRVPGQKRWFSTNHLVNKGYWVWVIPLASNTTSVGIVALKDLYPMEAFRTLDLARDWLARHEPAFSQLLQGFEVIDFASIRNYSHTSKRIFSIDRWACTGESGVFADPLYSPGSDLISFANCSISWMIGQDKAGLLTEEDTEQKSRFVISLSEMLTRSIQVNYHLMGSPNTMAAKLLWDFTAGWAVVQPLMFGKSFLQETNHKRIRDVSRNFFFMALNMNRFFSDWAALRGGNVGYTFFDYLSIDAIREMRARNCTPDKPIEALVEDMKENMDIMEELAIGLFRIAVADIHPDKAHLVKDTWINAWAINLDPATWESNSLFKPRTAPRDMSRLGEPLNRLFHVRPADPH